VEGALALLRQSDESAEQLRRKVTSPGGTTEAALGVLKAHRFKQAIVEAIAAATHRAEELSR
jgi:pyrroline-5-carboxylate reductase